MAERPFPPLPVHVLCPDGQERTFGLTQQDIADTEWASCQALVLRASDGTRLALSFALTVRMPDGHVFEQFEHDADEGHWWRVG